MPRHTEYRLCFSGDAAIPSMTAVRITESSTLAQVMCGVTKHNHRASALLVGGVVVPLDWTNRVVTNGHARKAIGTAAHSDWTIALLARILNIALDMPFMAVVPQGVAASPIIDVKLVEGDARHAVMYHITIAGFVRVVRGGRSMQSLRIGVVSYAGVVVLGVQLVCDVFGRDTSPTVESLTPAKQGTTFIMTLWKDGCAMDITRNRGGAYTLDAFDSGVESEDDDSPSYSALEEWCRVPPVLTVGIVPSLCWRMQRAHQPWVVRYGDALAAIRILRTHHCGHLLGIVMQHLALPPSEWLKGLAVQGSTVLARGGPGEVLYRFKPSTPLPKQCKLRLTVEGRDHSGFRQPRAEWFVNPCLDVTSHVVLF